MKICKSCEKDLPDNQFYVGTQKERGKIYKYLDSICRSCRLRYSANRRRDIKRQAVIYKGEVCVKCGIKSTHYEIYDFHHTDRASKDFSIAKVGGLGLESMKGELDKCELLCANCHRIEHSNNPI